MSIRLPFSLDIELELFQLEEAPQARALAQSANSVLYCWKTSGVFNWLEKGFSITDVLGIVLLPKGLPDEIDLPDDPPDAQD
jgi:hypothetical protein